ncbi:MAG: alpha-L-rhamnosidase N-terminal domain-containing protein [Phycisphaerae bacterium]
MECLATLVSQRYGKWESWNHRTGVPPGLARRRLKHPIRLTRPLRLTSDRYFRLINHCGWRAYICGLGYYGLYLNGTNVGDQVLAPAQTDYGRRHLSDLLYPVPDNGIKSRLPVGSGYYRFDYSPRGMR